MPELRVVRPQRHLPPVLQNEPHPAPGDRRHLRPLSVDQLAAVVVAGPADAVPGPDLDRARLVDVQIVADPSRRLDMARPAVGMAQHHPLALDPRHRQRLVLPHPVVDHVLVEHDCVAFPVVPHVALLGPRHAEAHQALDRERLAPQDPLVGQRRPDGPVDLRPVRVRRRQQQRPVPRLRRESQPDPRRLLPQLVEGDLVHAGAQQLHRLPGLARPRRQHRRAQHRVPLAPDLVHLHRRHPRPLQLEKGLPRLHRPKLARVAHQHQPGHAKPVRDPHQRAHPVGRHQRGLVQHHHGAAEHLLQPVLRPVVTERRAAARQKPLQGAHVHARLALQDARRPRLRREPQHRAVARELPDVAEHRRLAGPRPALHAHDTVARQQHRPHRFLLARRQAGARQVRRHLVGAGQRLPRTETRLHRRDHPPLRLQRPVGHVRPVRTPQLRFHQVAVPDHPCHRLADLAERVPPRRMAQRQRLELALREHRIALLETAHRATHDLQRRRRRR